PVVEMAFADLDHRGARCGRLRQAVEQPAAIGAPRRAPCPGHDADDGTPQGRLHDAGGTSDGVSSGCRRRNAATSSASPATAVITPTPETAPRTNGFARSDASPAVPAKTLRSQNADHGATTRMRPASRK